MAIRTNPSYATAHENLGDVYAKLASQAYSKALQLDTANTAVAPKLSLIRNIFTNGPKGTAVAAAAPAAAASVAKPPVAVAAAPAAPAPAPLVSGGDAQADVRAAVDAWAKAWASKDMGAYLGAYAPNFTPIGGQSRSGWEAERKARIVPRNRIEVDVTDLNIEVDGDRATARFLQAYSSDNLDVSSRKTLNFVRNGARWLIVREATGS